MEDIFKHSLREFMKDGNTTIWMYVSDKDLKVWTTFYDVSK